MLIKETETKYIAFCPELVDLDVIYNEGREMPLRFAEVCGKGYCGVTQCKGCDVTVSSVRLDELNENKNLFEKFKVFNTRDSALRCIKKIIKRANHELECCGATWAWNSINIMTCIEILHKVKIHEVKICHQYEIKDFEIEEK